LVRSEDLQRFLAHARVEDRHFGFGCRHFRGLRANRRLVDAVRLHQLAHAFACGADLFTGRLEFILPRFADLPQLRALIVGEVEAAEFHSWSAAHTARAVDAGSAGPAAPLLLLLRLILGKHHGRGAGQHHGRNARGHSRLETCGH
jgi:hypothetical protein